MKSAPLIQSDAEIVLFRMFRASEAIGRPDPHLMGLEVEIETMRVRPAAAATGEEIERTVEVGVAVVHPQRPVRVDRVFVSGANRPTREGFRGVEWATARAPTSTATAGRAVKAHSRP